MRVTGSDILNASILIVDDQEVNVALLEQLLADTGYKNVASTLNPREVCALHQQNHYDLILLDLQMPGMDGFMVMEGLKADTSESYLPVLVITAQPAQKLRALQAGAKDFISKPFDLVEARTRIHNMLEVRLLYKQLARYNSLLEETVLQRTAQLRESEARYRSLTQLCSDWYWEQDEHGTFTQTSGPVKELLAMSADSVILSDHGSVTKPTLSSELIAANAEALELLQANIAARKPFIDYVFTRANVDGSQQQFRVSGEPMFNEACRFVGYRGVGVEILTKSSASQ